MSAEQVSTVYTSSSNLQCLDPPCALLRPGNCPNQPIVHAATTSTAQRKRKRGQKTGSVYLQLSPRHPALNSHPHLCLPRWTESSWTRHCWPPACSCATLSVLRNCLAAETVSSRDRSSRDTHPAAWLSCWTRRTLDASRTLQGIKERGRNAPSPIGMTEGPSAAGAARVTRAMKWDVESSSRAHGSKYTGKTQN